jgi:hypothetical protein
MSREGLKDLLNLNIRSTKRTLVLDKHKVDVVKICKTYIRTVAIYQAESWALNKDIAKWLATFRRKVLRRMCGGIKVNENWRKRCNTELMQLFGHLGILSFVRISHLNWTGLVKKMDSKRKVSQAFNSNPQGNQN